MGKASRSKRLIEAEEPSMQHETIKTECERLGLQVRQVPAERMRSYSATGEDGVRVYWSTSYEGGLLGLPRVVDRTGKDTHARNLKEIAYLVKFKEPSSAKRVIENDGYREAELGDFLNDNQMQACIDILNRPDIDDIAQTKELKRYLNQFKVDLEAKGILPDYLAYVLIANADELRRRAARRTGLN